MAKEPLNETLLGQSAIWLFGRKMNDIQLVVTPYKQYPVDDNNIDANDTPARAGNNNLLLNQFRFTQAPILARIYAFSFEGQYYDMQRPAIFLVHGDGIDPEGPAFRTPRKEGDISRSPPHVGRTGVGTQIGNFARDMKAWSYDRADFTIRLDVENGSFDNVLLAQELSSPDAMTQSAGSFVRSAGSFVRSAARASARPRNRGGSSGSE